MEFTKKFYNKKNKSEEELEEDEAEDEENKEKKKKEDMILKFSEFRIFLQTLRQYYIYCQIFKNNEVEEEKKVNKQRLAAAMGRDQ